MALRVNGTTLPDTGTIRFNGSDVKKVIYNGTTVWTKMTQSGTAYISAQLSLGSTQSSGTRTCNVYVTNYQQGFATQTTASTTVNCKFVYTVAGEQKETTVKLESGKTNGAGSFTLSNSASLHWVSVQFYNTSNYLMNTTTVGEDVTGSTKKNCTVPILQTA